MSTEIEGESTAEQGSPALAIAGLRLWLHGRKDPSAHDPDEGNRIRATIRYDSDGVSVKAEEANVRASDIARWTRDARALLKGTTALARLSLKRRIFEIVLQATDNLDVIRMQVAVAPGEGVKARSFAFDIDRQELAGIVQQCDGILTTYPVRGTTLPEEV